MSSTQSERYIVLQSMAYEGMWVPGDDNGYERPMPSFRTVEDAEAYAKRLGIRGIEMEILKVAFDG